MASGGLDAAPASSIEARDNGHTGPASPAADYAPSPNTSQQVVGRANQLRIQALLRRLLASAGPTAPAATTPGAGSAAKHDEEWRRSRIDTLRMLRKTLRECDFQLSWITQIDLLETLERILREDCQDERPPEQLDWRLVHDCTQLLVESIPRLAYELDEQTLEQLVPLVVQNLGHERSEVRRASLLMLNMLLNHKHQQHFGTILRVFIEYGLSNYCNEQAQRGAILSLPLLMTEQVVERQDLQALVSCLGELLIESHEQLFYSLYLALQRLHMMMGDERFGAYLSQCEPEARHLYKQAASRSSSLVAGVERNARAPSTNGQRRRSSSIGRRAKTTTSLKKSSLASAGQQHVTFEGVGASGQSAPGEQCQTSGNEDNDNHGDHDDESGAGDDNELATGARRRDETASDEAASSPLGSADDGTRAPQPKRPSYASSDVSSTCSSDAHLVNPAHYMSEAALRGRPMDDYEKIHHVDHSNVTSLAINDMGLVCNTPTVELGPGGLVSVDSVRLDDDDNGAGVSVAAAAPGCLNDEAVPGGCAAHAFSTAAGSGEMKFGIFPRHLIQIALGAAPRYTDRLDAMQELMCIVRESPINHLAILMSYFDSFLEQFLARLVLPNTDYKLELIAVDMLETIVVKTKVSTMQYVRPIVSLLVKTLADSRAQQVFRAQTCRVLHKIMAYLPPQHVIDALFEHKHSRTVLVREEAINRVTGAVLEYDRNEFNLTKLCYHVLPMLADTHSGVRLAALECIATLAHALGPERIGSLLTAAEAVQTGCDYDGLLDAISARLRRHALPRCNSSDGSIRHVLRPFLSSSAAAHEQQPLAADVRWILEAPSSHQHSPRPFYRPQQQQQQQRLHTSYQQQQQQQQQQHELQEEHHHHRLGVYSPPSVALRQRRRRSSIGLAGLVGDDEPPSRHHHHHRLHSKRRDSSGGAERPHQRQPAGPSDEAKCAQDEHKQTDGQSAPIASQRRKSCESRARDSAQPQSSETINTEHSGARASRLDSSPEQRCQRRQSDWRAHQSSGPGQQQQHVQMGPCAARRSNSQDSISSTDTNKVLFQYYLGKFKQSLAEATLAHQPAVLPSDSIIYTDINQAYAFSRHQSRYQQTSFDKDDEWPLAELGTREASRQTVPSNSVGPSAHSRRQELSHSKQQQPPPPPPQQQQQQQQQQQRRRGAESSHEAQTETPETSESDSPLTVMEACSKEQSQRQAAGAVQAPTARRRSSSRAASSPASRQVSDSARTPSREQSQETADGRQSDEAPRGPKRALVRQEAPAAERQSFASTASAEQQLSRQASSATINSSSGPESGADQRQAAQRASRHRSSEVRERQQSQRADEHARQQQAKHDEQEAQQRQLAARRRSSVSQPPAKASVSHAQQQAAAGEQGEASGARRSLSRASSKQSVVDASTPPSGTAQPRSAKQTSAARCSDEIAPPSALAEQKHRPRRAISVSPSLACNINIRHILENVAEIEGPFADAQLALKVALHAIESPCWSAKVEGIMALIRLINFHQQTLIDSGQMHELVCHVTDETRNLRSTVARSAIFALGELCAKLKRSIEPQIELIVQSLLQKSMENTAFLRDDIRKSLSQMVENLTHWRLANFLINHGASHKSVHVRRMASQFIAQLVERMGAAKCLVGAKEISSQLIPAAAKFAQDNSPFTRFYGRSILAKLMQHGSFDRLLRHNLTPNLYRSTLGIIESVKRRGPGELPTEN